MTTCAMADPRGAVGTKDAKACGAVQLTCEAGERGECAILDRRGTAALKEYPVEERRECATLDRKGIAALKESPVPISIRAF